MDWLAAEEALIATRALQYSATAIVTGVLIFRVAVAWPVLRAEDAAREAFRRDTAKILWGGLVVAAMSGAIWLALEAVSMSGLPPSDAMTANTLSTVLNETQFGQVTEVRAGLALLLAACLASDRLVTANWFGLVVALGFAGSLAWTGHAGSTVGELGLLHLSADVLHLCTASAWIGGLVALIQLLAAVRWLPRWTVLAHDATQRFSNLGLLSVVVLSVTGFINACILVGSLHALTVTEYGRVLMLKLCLVLVMLVFAAINRFRLTPRLAPASAEKGKPDSLRGLIRNSAIETVLGLAILATVGLLGTLHPAIHLVK